jgi:uncharacterized protein involved in exopolysaccharide biosynthesis
MNKLKPTNQHYHVEEDEIDLIALVKTLWEGRKTVIKSVLIFMVIGLFVAILSPKEYTASTTFVPQISDSKIGGNLGGLAAMAGIDLGSLSSDSGISPALYPQIVNSIPFQLELLQTPLTIEGQSEQITFIDYYTNIHSLGLLGYLKKYTIGLPMLIIKSIKGKSKAVFLNEVEGSNSPISITTEESVLIKQLKKQISLEIDQKDGYVMISTNMPEAISSAEFTKKIQELLQQYIIDFKVQKSSEQLKFIQERYTEKEQEFKKTQQKLANFRDHNQHIISAIAHTELQGLQSEYDLAYSIYAELSKHLETQQIQVKEDTPVFTVLKSVYVPVESSKPKRVIILFIWTFIGGIVGVGLLIGKEYLREIKKKWKTESSEFQMKD